MAEHSNTIGIARFRDYVRELPHQWILDNLISADGPRRILSSAMVKEAAAKFAGKAALAERFRGLSPEMRLKCARVYLMGGNGLSADNPAACAKEPLLTSLLVFAAQNGAVPCGVRLFGFDEFEPALRTLMAETVAEAAVAADCRPAPPPPICPWRPLNDIAAVCALAAHGQLRRSAHGGLARSALSALKKLTHDPTLTGKSVSEGLSGHPAGFLIGFCLSDGLIIGDDCEYRLNRQKCSAWLETSMKERMYRLASYAVRFTGGFGAGVLHESLACVDGRWLSVSAVVPEADRALFERALNVFEFLGRAHVCRGGSPDGMIFVGVRPAGGNAGDVYGGDCCADIDRLFAGEPARETLIMSDFNVVIPQEASPSELFDFSKIGLLTEFDKVYKGQITKESVSNALSAGVDPSYLRLWLRDRRASANVAKTVDEWIREFSRLFVSDGPVLVSSDEKVTRQISALEPLRKHLTEVGAHAVFTIRPGSEQKVLDILDKLGFDTRAPGDYGTEDSVDAGTGAAVRAPSDKRRWEPLTDFSSAAVESQATPPMSRTKYGAGLKPLETSEMIHVIDYAILTNQALVIDYAGSAYAKQGVYTVVPVSIDKGLDAAVEADMRGVRGRKLFYLNKINRIGVVSL